MRQNKGLSQEGLADLIGMTQSNYSRRESGKKRITEFEWKKIAKALNVDLEELYIPTKENDHEKTSEIENNDIQDEEFVTRYIKSLESENSELREKIKAFKRYLLFQR
ncbi:helix-turn-helix domain-containing protein [Flavobacterium sp. LAR06]|uniref:helix-turn-helix domain-containing protein n=1 Tax=Flavobacterium sp. LAR06 TaxID=3064897 RepID=UPI0035C1C4E5